jgi:hypothetical protein
MSFEGAKRGGWSGPVVAGGRPFRLVDAMILTAATAVGFAGARWLAGGLGPLGIELWRGCLASWTGAFQSLVMLGWPLPAAWSAALIPIRLIAPRPPRRRWAARPGMAAACSTTLAGAVLAAAAFIPPAVSEGGQGMRVGGDYTALWTLAVAPSVGLAILASWATLAAGGRWRPEPTWIDRLGRLVAFVWFLMALGALYVLDQGLNP